MSLEFRHIAHAYNDVRALDDISFIAPTGEITCLLGASGCGKSTLLNLAAGLLPVQIGAILIDDTLLADETKQPPPEERPVGLVFQDGALFPHMTIAKNIAFGMQNVGALEIDNWLSRVGLEGLGARYPHELSGGQRQRAALARAMAPAPQILLMDEPFASVDIVLRRKLRRDCRRLLQARGATTILVTHDPEEALDIGDRIAVMEAGQIVQFDSPQTLYDAPATASVGALFGGAHIVRAVRSEMGFLTEFGEWPFECALGEVPASQEFDLLVYSNDIELLDDSEGLFVRDVQRVAGKARIAFANSEGAELTIESYAQIDVMQNYRLTPRPGSLRAFARD